MANHKIDIVSLPAAFAAEEREHVRQVTGELIAIHVYRELQRVGQSVADAGCSIIGNCSGGGSCDIIGNCSSSKLEFRSSRGE